MSEPVQVECPKCHSKLKVKDQSAFGKRIACPKCKRPFVIKPPEDDDLAFLNVSEEDAVAEDAPPTEETGDAETPSHGRRASSRKKKQQRKREPLQWQKPALIAGIALLLVGLLVGGGFLVANLIGSGFRNKIDTAWLPTDAEVFVLLRPGDAWNAPFAQSILNVPSVKPFADQILAEAKAQSTIDLFDIEFMTIGVAGTGNLASAVATMPGMAGGMPRMQGAPGPPDLPAIIKLHLKQPTQVDFTAGPSAMQRAEHNGTAYYRNAPSNGEFCIMQVDSRTLVGGSEAELKRAIERGKKSERRADLDFVDNSRHLAIVYVPKEPATFDKLFEAIDSASRMGAGGGMGGGPPGMPGGAMPGMPGGGMPAMPGMPGGGGAPGAGMGSAARGKVRGVAFYTTLTNDIEYALAVNCIDADAASQLSAELSKSIDQSKSQFAQMKGQLQLGLGAMGLGDVLNVLETIVNNPQASANGTIAQMQGTIPASLKTAIETVAANPMVNALIENAGQGGNPFGGGLPLGNFLGGFGPAGDGQTEEPAEPDTDSANPQP